MHPFILIASAAAVLAGCGQSGGNGPANQTAGNAAQVKKRPAYCFFKDAETRGWTASRGKDGNIVVEGKVYRSDSRYKAVLGSPTITGASAEIAPSITVNTGYAAPDNWWDVSAVIPGSAAVTTVAVRCGAKTLAELTVAE